MNKYLINRGKGITQGWDFYSHHYHLAKEREKARKGKKDKRQKKLLLTAEVNRIWSLSQVGTLQNRA